MKEFWIKVVENLDTESPAGILHILLRDRDEGETWNAIHVGTIRSKELLNSLKEIEGCYFLDARKKLPNQSRTNHD